MLCIALWNALNGLVIDEPPWGFIYTSTFSMDDGDLFDLTTIITLPEYSI